MGLQACVYTFMIIRRLCFFRLKIFSVGKWVPLRGWVVLQSGEREGGGDKLRKMAYVYSGVSHFPPYSGKFAVDLEIIFGGQYFLSTPNTGKWGKHFLKNVLPRKKHSLK